MDTIFLYNQNNDKFPTDVVRYFKMNGKKYFIFTLNETDDNGYIQLYATRIENEYGKLIMKYISDEEEWSSFKAEIQKIVNDNRNGLKYSNDLDYSELDNMVVTEFRIFKLKESVAKELSSNKNAVKDTEPKSLEAASARESSLTIEEILKQVSDRASKEPTYPTYSQPEEKEEIPTVSKVTSDDSDYKKKYEELLRTVKNLEDENIKLINELVECKAKLSTIKDIIE